MTYSTPRRLSCLAARVFVDDFLLESQPFQNSYRYGKSLFSFEDDLMNAGMTNEEYNNEISEKCRQMNQMKLDLLIIECMVNKMLKNCDKKTMQSICEILRTTSHYCTIGVCILQLVCDTEIFFSHRHRYLFGVLLELRKRFPLIERLTFDGVANSTFNKVLTDFFQLVPNLKSFKGDISGEESNCMDMLQAHCPKLEHLGFYTQDDNFSLKKLVKFFFTGSTIADIRLSYSRLDDNVQISFPQLQSLTMNVINEDQYDFFKMFFHYYPNVNFHVGIENYKDHATSTNVSWFDAVLSHNVVINPDIKIKQCDLNLRDLFLPFCEQNIMVWNNVDCLMLSIGGTSKRNKGSMTLIGKKLESLLGMQQNIKEIGIRLIGPMSEDEVSEMLYPTFRSFGSRMSRLKFIGMQYFLSHRTLVQLINFCPNLKQLGIVGKRVAKYIKDVKLNKLNKLESLKVMWSDTQTNAIYSQWISRVTNDLIQHSPNLTVLYVSANIYLLDYLVKNKFATQLKSFTIDFHTEKSCQGLDHLKKMLPLLPHLKELVVKECYYDVECRGTCFTKFTPTKCRCCKVAAVNIYKTVDLMISHTQVYQRHYTHTDSEIFF